MPLSRTLASGGTSEFCVCWNGASITDAITNTENMDVMVITVLNVVVLGVEETIGLSSLGLIHAASRLRLFKDDILPLTWWNLGSYECSNLSKSLTASISRQKRVNLSYFVV